MGVLFLTESDVRAVLTVDVALPLVEAAFRKISLDEAENVPRRRVQTDHVMLHVLPAAAKTMSAIGLKAYTTTKDGAKFHVTLFDPRTGGLTAIVEADYLGQVRTGAASGVATKKLARKDASTVGVLGTGKQARTQLAAVCKVRPIKHATVYGRDADRRAAFAAEMAGTLGIDVRPADTAEAAVRGHDVVCTITTAREPVLFGEWVSPGTHLNVAGSNFLSKSETDVALYRKASLVCVDSKEQAKLEAGDFVAPLKDGVLTWTDILDFPHVLAGRYPGRANADDVTVFKSLGLGVQDVAVAAKVVELARQRGIGTELPI